MRVGLLRHGEVRGGPCFRGHTDDPLTATGWDQMRAAVTDDQRWDRVISSPLARCAAFARIFAERRALPLLLDRQLREMHFGAWEGRSAAELMAEDPVALTDFWRDPERCPPPGGESLDQFKMRVLAAWDQMVREHVEQRLLVITHGGVIRVLLSHLLKRPFRQLQQFEVAYGGLYTLQIDGDGTVRTDFDLTLGT